MASWRLEQHVRVIVVDHDVQLAEMLACEGYEVHRADSYGTLVEVFCELADDELPGPPVDVIVADAGMLRISEIEGLKRLAVARGVAVPAMVMTTFPDDELERRAGDLGVHLLHKPFSVDEMRRAALHVLIDP